MGAGDLSANSFSTLVSEVFSDNGSGRDELQALAANWDAEVGGALSSKTNSGVLLGVAQYLLGDLSAAVETLSEHKSSEWARVYLVKALAHQGKTGQARKVADELYKKAPDLADAAFLAAEARIADGDAEAADEILGAIEGSHGSSSEYLFCRGLQRAKQGEYFEGIDLLRQAVAVNGTNYEAHFRLGFYLDLYGSGDGDEDPLLHYEKCLEAKPVHSNAVINLGLLYEDREHYHDAIKCFEAVLGNYPTHPRAKLFLGDARACTSMFYDKEQEKKADRHSQVLKIPVSDFELSVRSRNSLQKMNIDTLGDLIMKTEQELLSYKNFGETSLQEIKEMLNQKGLRLGQGLEEQSGEAPTGRNPLEATTAPEVLDRTIDELALSVRSRRCMDRLAVRTLRDLINKTEVELMSAKNFGMTSLNEIKMKLKEMGLGLRS